MKRKLYLKTVNEARASREEREQAQCYQNSAGGAGNARAGGARACPARAGGAVANPARAGLGEREGREEEQREAQPGFFMAPRAPGEGGVGRRHIFLAPIVASSFHPYRRSIVWTTWRAASCRLPVCDCDAQILYVNERPGALRTYSSIICYCVGCPVISILNAN